MKLGPLPMLEVDSNRPTDPQSALGKRFAEYNHDETVRHMMSNNRYESWDKQTSIATGRQPGKSFSYLLDLENIWTNKPVLEHISWSEVNGPDFRPLCVYKTSQNSHIKQLWLLTKDELHRIKGWFEVDTTCDVYNKPRSLDKCLNNYSVEAKPQNGSAAIVIELIKPDRVGVKPRLEKASQTARVWFQDEADAVDFSMRVKSDGLRFGVPYFYDHRDYTKPERPTRPWW